MSLIQVGLLDRTGELDAGLMHSVAAALNVQVTRDLPQFWHIQATVSALPKGKVPSGVWPVFLVKELPPGEGGFHLDKHNQPYAEVIAHPGSDGWTVAASHEVIEMLVDPNGNRLQSSRAIAIQGGKIREGAGEFEYLVEACDPCEADEYAYSILGVAVSDFLTPHFYDPVVTPGTRYSFTGALRAPREILPGGYISWINQENEEWQQLQYIDPKQPPKIVNLGPASGKSLREWVHTKNRDAGLKTTRYLSEKRLNTELMKRTKERREHLDKIATKRAAMYEIRTR